MVRYGASHGFRASASRPPFECMKEPRRAARIEPRPNMIPSHNECVRTSNSLSFQGTVHGRPKVRCAYETAGRQCQPAPGNQGAFGCWGRGGVPRRRCGRRPVLATRFRVEPTAVARTAVTCAGPRVVFRDSQFVAMARAVSERAPQMSPVANLGIRFAPSMVVAPASVSTTGNIAVRRPRCVGMPAARIRSTAVRSGRERRCACPSGRVAPMPNA